MKIICCLLLMLAVAGCASQTVIHGVPNLAEVAPSIYRGGEPTAEGWAYLKSLGVTNCVKLNLEPSLKVGGIDTVYCPINFLHQLVLKPSAETVFNAVDCIQPGTYIHCLHGQDRTGLVIAEWREFKCDWTREDARKEMLAHGFHPFLFGLEHFWEEH